jgi:hypothetical protein
MCWEAFSPPPRLEFMENDQSIKESTLNCPSKRLRRRLWAVLGGYCWRRSRLVSWCRARLPIVFCPFDDSSTHQRYINLVYNLCLVYFISHTRSFWCFRWKFSNLYISYTDKIPTDPNPTRPDSGQKNQTHIRPIYLQVMLGRVGSRIDTPNLT